MSERENSINLATRTQGRVIPPALQKDLFPNFTHHPLCGEWEGRGKDWRTEEEKGGPPRGGGAEE